MVEDTIASWEWQSRPMKRNACYRAFVLLLGAYCWQVNRSLYAFFFIWSKWSFTKSNALPNRQTIGPNPFFVLHKPVLEVTDLKFQFSLAITLPHSTMTTPITIINNITINYYTVNSFNTTSTAITNSFNDNSVSPFYSFFGGSTKFLTFSILIDVSHSIGKLECWGHPWGIW